jgi:hypothetical protein
MLIAIMGWKEPSYTFFGTRPKPNCGVRYLSLGVMSDAKHKKMNTVVFEGYLRDLQEAISNMWRITPQVVAQYRDIANFKATRHAMWIQVWKDPNKQWLQMRYCIMEGDIDMAIKDWEDDWKIPSLTQEIPTKTTEEEAGQEETQPQEVPVPKKWRMGQKKQSRQMKGQLRQGPRRGKRILRSRLKNNRNRLRKHKGLHQVPIHKNQA